MIKLRSMIFDTPATPGWYLVTDKSKLGLFEYMGRKVWHPADDFGKIKKNDTYWLDFCVDMGVDRDRKPDESFQRDSNVEQKAEKPDDSIEKLKLRFEILREIGPLLEYCDMGNHYAMQQVRNFKRLLIDLGAPYED